MSIPGPVLFNVFINDLDDGTECSLSSFTNDTKLGGVTDMLDGCTAPPLVREESHEVQLGEMKVLHLGRRNPMHQ